MPLSKAHPLRDIHASHSRKLTISVLAIPFSRLFLSSLLLFPSLFFHFLPVFSFIFLLFSVPVTFAREAIPSRHERFHGTNSVPTSRIFVAFPIVGSPRDPVPVARISSIKRDVEVRIDEEVSVQNVERLLILYDSGTKRTRARNSKVRFKNVRRSDVRPIIEDINLTSAVEINFHVK